MMKNILIFFLLFFICNSQAQVTWDGGAGTNNWNHANNWNPNGVPSATDDVQIDLVGSIVIVPAGYNAVAATILIMNGVILRINPNAKLTVDASGSNLTTQGIYMTASSNNQILNYGTLICRNADKQGIFLDGGYFYNEGIVRIINYSQNPVNTGEDAFKTMNENETFNNGVFSIKSNQNMIGANGINVFSDCSFENGDGGLIRIKNIEGASTSAIINLGQFENFGIINIDNGGSEAGIMNANNSVTPFRNTGHINITNTPIGIINRQGLFKGKGFINVPNMENRGIISPGFNYSIWSANLAVDGDFSFSSGYVYECIYEVDVLGTDGSGEPDGNDVISEINDLSISDCTLDVSMQNGFYPSILDEFTILEYSGTLTGEFDIVNLPSPEMDGWEVHYSTPGEVILRYPPPSPLVSNTPNNIIESKDSQSDLDNNKLNNYSIFPNPSNREIVTLTGKDIEQVRIFNSTGQVIKEIKFSGLENSKQIDTKGWDVGTYFIKIDVSKVLRLVVF